MVLGIDNGYSYTKDSNGNIFRSGYSLSQMICGGKKIVINDKDYYVGTGTQICDVDKVDSELNMVTTMMCLCINDQARYKIVAGLPIGQYAAQKNKLRDKILSYNDLKVDYAGYRMHIAIDDVMVAPQGASILYYCGICKDCVIVDVGGLTVDVAQIDFIDNAPSIVKSNTYYKGMRTLYNSIVEAVNMKYNLRLDTEEADKIIRNGFYYQGDKQSLDFLRPILIDYITPIAEELKLNYNTDTNTIVLMGGGGTFLYKAMCNRFPSVILISDSQFGNAKGYYYYGIKKWGKE